MELRCEFNEEERYEKLFPYLSTVALRHADESTNS